MARPLMSPPPPEVLTYLSYDPEMGVLRWKACPPGSHARVGAEAGTVTKPGGYRTVRFMGRIYQAHRLAWYIAHGEWPASLIDHINGKKSDNRLANLRKATDQQNCWNRVPVGHLPKGVTFHRKSGKFQAVFQSNHRNVYLGLFSTPEAAHEAWRSVALDVQGEFARFQ